MGGFADLIRNGVALASDLTRSLQATITIAPWTGADGYGKDTFGTPVSITALVDKTQRQRYTSSGRLVNVYATITVLDPIAPNGASGRVNPVDPRDKVTLADGSTAPIVESGGFEDADNTRPFVNTIVLGTVMTG